MSKKDKSKAFAKQNLSGYSLGWKLLVVPDGYVYGAFNGFDFIAEPKISRKYRKIPVQVYQNNRVVKHPEKRVIDAIVNAIMQDSTLKLSEWDYEADWEKAVKANEDARERREQAAEQQAIQSAHINWTSAERKPSKHPRRFLKWYKGI